MSLPDPARPRRSSTVVVIAALVGVLVAAIVASSLLGSAKDAAAPSPETTPVAHLVASAGTPEQIDVTSRDPRAAWNADRSAIDVLLGQGCTPGTVRTRVVDATHLVITATSAPEPTPDPRSIDPGFSSGCATSLMTVHVPTPAGIDRHGAVSIELTFAWPHAASARTTTMIPVEDASALTPLCDGSTLTSRASEEHHRFGKHYWDVELTQTSTTPCALKGRPRARVLGTDAAALEAVRTEPSASDHYVIGARTVLARGDRVYLRVESDPLWLGPGKCHPQTSATLELDFAFDSGSVSTPFVAGFCTTDHYVGQVVLSGFLDHRTLATPWQQG